MGTTVQKLQYLSETKALIKDAIEGSGVLVPTGTTFRQFADKISEIKPKNVPAVLPYTAKTFGEQSVNVSDFVKIYASNGQSYTPEEWYNLIGKGSSILPIGFEMEALGQHFVIYFYDGDLPSYKEVSGSVADNMVAPRHSMCNYNLITAAGNYNNPDGTTAQATVSGNIITLTTTNSPFSWQISTDCGNRNTFQDPTKDIDRLTAIYNQCEWLRHRASLKSTITSSLPDGTYADRVDIVEDNGDLYFKIIVDASDSTKDIVTPIKAKYNKHSFMTGANPTDAIIDAIYTSQVTVGTNMNRGLNSSDLLKVLTPGAKGAEAYVYEGYWRIVTPILSNCSATFSVEKNIPDAPAVYYWNNVLKQKYGDSVQLSNEMWLFAYYLNRSTILNSYTSFLNSAAGGSCNIPSTISSSVWCAARSNATNAWYVNATYGGMSGSSVFSRCTVLSASDLS